MKQLPLLALLLLPACAGSPTAPPAPVHLDAAAWADDHFFFFRFRIDEQYAALQGNPTPIAIQLDADGDPATGRTSRLEPFKSLGLDLEIEFSPAHDGKPGKGVVIRRLNTDGSSAVVSSADSGLTVTPTCASDWFEARISRDLWPALSLPDNPATLRGVFVSKTLTGAIDGYSDPFSVSPPPHAPTVPVDAELPAKAPKALRVLTYNVNKSTPLTTPEPFSRVLFATNPDVVLMQEVAAGDAAKWTSWFTVHASRGDTWHVRKTDAGDVLIASRLPLEPFGPDALEMTDEQGKSRPVRFIAAKVTTPSGPQVFATLHLKCCGTLGSREDHTRIAEANALNLALLNELSHARDPKNPRALPIVLGGDFNLVGSREVIGLAAHQLDVDGSDLDIAEPYVFGDYVKTTWIDWSTEFSPSRLDFILFGNHAAKPAQAFVIDTARLSDRVLFRADLHRTDSSASDHLPVVVDLLPTN